KDSLTKIQQSTRLRWPRTLPL
ncbi:hypothetical protein DBR06_SOUSAS2910026, partial [Sousa chinensis]